MVVLNSLTQHFVSMNYLVEVLRQACQMTRPGGHVFVGDVTAWNTRTLYFAQLAYSRADAGVSVREILDRISRLQADERELVIDPLWFFALPLLIPGIENVLIELKSGRYTNELSMYRYDVTLAIGSDETQFGLQQPRSLGWSADQTLDSIRPLVEEHFANSEAPLRIQGIPNRRTAFPEGLLEALNTNPDACKGDIAIPRWTQNQRVASGRMSFLTQLTAWTLAPSR